MTNYDARTTHVELGLNYVKKYTRFGYLLGRHAYLWMKTHERPGLNARLIGAQKFLQQ